MIAAPCPRIEAGAPLAPMPGMALAPARPCRVARRQSPPNRFPLGRIRAPPWASARAPPYCARGDPACASPHLASARAPPGLAEHGNARAPPCAAPWARPACARAPPGAIRARRSHGRSRKFGRTLMIRELMIRPLRNAISLDVERLHERRSGLDRSMQKHLNHAGERDFLGFLRGGI
jgi:hypothetical protein